MSLVAPPLELRIAGNAWQRLRGLLGHPAPPCGSGLWILRCRAVHTCGMRYPVDVAFLDCRGRVLRVARLAPWRAAWCRHADSVVELRAGCLVAGAQGREWIESAVSRAMRAAGGVAPGSPPNAPCG